MRIFPNFLALLSIIALVVALVAGLELIVGFGDSIATLIARYFGYLDNTTLMATTRILISLAIMGVVFIVLRLIWRFAATLPSRNLDMQQDTGDINAEIRQHFREIKQGNTKANGKGRNEN